MVANNADTRPRNGPNGLIGPNGHSKNATNGQYLTYVPLVAFFVRERNRPPYHKKLPVEGLSLESNALAIWRDEHNTSLLTSDMSDDIHKA